MICKIFTLWVFKKKTRAQIPSEIPCKPVVYLDGTASRHKPTEHHIRKNWYFTHKWLACTKTITWIIAVFSGQSLTRGRETEATGKITLTLTVKANIRKFFSSKTGILPNWLPLGKFWNGCFSFNIGPIKTKLKNVANLNVLFLRVFFYPIKKDSYPAPLGLKLGNARLLERGGIATTGRNSLCRCWSNEHCRPFEK